MKNKKKNDPLSRENIKKFFDKHPIFRDREEFTELAVENVKWQAEQLGFKYE